MGEFRNKFVHCGKTGNNCDNSLCVVASSYRSVFNQKLNGKLKLTTTKIVTFVFVFQNNSVETETMCGNGWLLLWAFNLFQGYLIGM